MLLVLESLLFDRFWGHFSLQTEPALVMSRSDVGDDALKSASQLSLAISLLSDANTGRYIGPYTTKYFVAVNSFSH